MTHRIGPKQRAILQAIADGQELWRHQRHWEMNGKTVNQERCLTLYFRGYLMGMGIEDSRERFQLTDNGKAAL